MDEPAYEIESPTKPDGDTLLKQSEPIHQDETLLAPYEYWEELPMPLDESIRAMLAGCRK